MSVMRWKLSISILLGLLLSPALAAEEAIDRWREDVTAVRQLAENNIPAAYDKALQLRVEMPVEATVADRVRLLNVLARIETYGANTKQASQYIKQAMTLATEANDQLGLAEAALNQILNAVNRAAIDDMSNAADLAMTALKGSDRVDLQSETILRSAMLMLRRHQFDDAIKLAIETMELAKRSGDHLALMYAHQGLAIVYGQSGNPEKSYQNYQLMADQAREANSKIWLAFALLGLGERAGDLGNIPEAEMQIRQGVEVCGQVGAPFCVAQGQLALAKILQKQGRHARALPLFDKAVAIYEQRANKIALWWTLIARSASYQSLGKWPEAQQDAEYSYALAEKIGQPLLLGESSRHLAKLAAAKGDYRRAYEYMAGVVEKQRQMEKDNSNKLITALAEHYVNEGRQRRIRDLTLRADRQTAQQRLLIVVLICALLILMGGGYFLWRLRRSHRLLVASHDQMRQMQESQRAILDALPDLLFEMGPDGRYLDFHTVQLNLLAAPAEVLIGKTAAEVMSQDAAGIVMAALREARKTGVSFGKQFRLQLAEGDFWFELSVARMGEEGSGSPRFIVLSRDVTDRKRFQLQEEMQRRVFETLIRGGELGEILNIIPEYFERVYADSRVSILLADEDGYSFSTVVTPGLPAEFIRTMERAAANTLDEEWNNSCGEIVTFENMREHLQWVACRQAVIDAGLQDCWSIPVCGTAGNVLGIINILRCQSGGPTAEESAMLQRTGQVVAIVIEHRRMDDALRAREHNFRTMATNSPDYISRFDTQARRTYINHTLVPSSRQSMDKLLGKTPVEVFSSPESRITVDLILEVCRTGQERVVARSYRRRDGKLQWLDMRFVPEFEPSGKVTSVLAIGRDITELKEAKESLEKSYSHLQALAAKQETAREEERHRISRELHDELGQILTAIRLETSLLKLQYCQDDGQFQDKVAHIVSLVDDTIRDVRNVVGLLRPVALERGIVDALEWLADEFASKGVRCLLSFSEGQISTMDDAYSIAIFRITQESLTNVVRHAGADAVRISLELSGGGYRLQISDNGRGFDPMLQKEKSTGLMGIRERVNRLNGRLAIDSAPGCGVTLDIYLPASKSL